MNLKNFIRGFNWGAKPQQDQGNNHPQPPQQQPQQQPAQPRPVQMAQAAPQPNMFQEHAAMQADMYAATNAAWARELASRKQIAQNERDRQHEYDLELLRQQGAVAQRQAETTHQPHRPSAPKQQARNRGLLGMAGMGGYTIHKDGYGNTSFAPHAFGNSPIARSLLG